MDSDVNMVVVNRAWLVTQYTRVIAVRDEMTRPIPRDRERVACCQGQLRLMRDIWKLDSGVDSLHETACGESREKDAALLRDTAGIVNITAKLS